MVTPDLGPLLGGLGGEERPMRGQVSQQRVDQVDHRLGASAGVIESVVPFIGDQAVYLAQQLRVAGAPSVEALLQVAHEECGPPLGLLLVAADDLHEVVLEDLPLAGARVLELVEQPVLHAAIQTVIDVELTLGVEQQGDVVAEGQTSPLADLPVIDLVIALQ